MQARLILLQMIQFMPPFDADVSIRLGSSNNLFSNIVFLHNATSLDLTNNSGSGNNLSNVEFRMAFGNIMFPGVIQLINETNITTDHFNISQNNAFLNSSNLTFLNTSAQITLTNITFLNPIVKIDVNDSGVFEPCNATQCVNISYNNGVFIFNVSSFTTYKAAEGADDLDGDGVPDVNDTLAGVEDNVTKEGVTDLNITVGGNASNGTFTGMQEVIFKDGATLLLNFSHNFSNSTLNLTTFTIRKNAKSLVVNTSGQVSNKTLFLPKIAFIALCAKDAEIDSADEITTDCSGPFEILLTACLGNAGGVTVDNVTCKDDGALLSFSNLRFSGVSGSTASGGSSSGGGGGGSASRYYNTLSRSGILRSQELAISDTVGTVKLVSPGIEYNYTIAGLDASTFISAIGKNNITLDLMPNSLVIDLTRLSTVKHDVDNDGFYDLAIRVLGISSNLATLEFKPIHEEVGIEPDPQPGLTGTGDEKLTTGKSDTDVMAPTARFDNPAEVAVEPSNERSGQQLIIAASGTPWLFGLLGLIVIVGIAGCFYRKEIKLWIRKKR